MRNEYMIFYSQNKYILKTSQAVTEPPADPIGTRSSMNQSTKSKDSHFPNRGLSN